MGTLYERIEFLCTANGINLTSMCKGAGVSRGSITDLKVGRNKTLKPDTLDKIADYFDTTVDYLLGRTDDPENSDRFGLEDPVDLSLDYLRVDVDGQENAPAQEGEREIVNPDIRMIARAGKKMTPEQAENLRKYAEFMFPEAFKNGDDI